MWEYYWENGGCLDDNVSEFGGEETWFGDVESKEDNLYEDDWVVEWEVDEIGREGRRE